MLCSVRHGTVVRFTRSPSPDEHDIMRRGGVGEGDELSLRPNRLSPTAETMLKTVLPRATGTWATQAGSDNCQ